MDSVAGPSSSPTKRKRKIVRVACNPCRKRKLKVRESGAVINEAHERSSAVLSDLPVVSVRGETSNVNTTRKVPTSLEALQ